MDQQPEAFNEVERQDAAFERELAAALARVDAPPSLEARLMAAIAREPQHSGSPRTAEHGRLLAFPRQRAWFGGAIAAALLLATFSLEGLHLHHEHQLAQARQAQQQYEEAQQITNRALEQARQQLEQAGVSLDGE